MSSQVTWAWTSALTCLAEPTWSATQQRECWKCEMVKGGENMGRFELRLFDLGLGPWNGCSSISQCKASARRLQSPKNWPKRKLHCCAVQPPNLPLKLFGHMPNITSVLCAEYYLRTNLSSPQIPRSRRQADTNWRVPTSSNGECRRRSAGPHAKLLWSWTGQSCSLWYHFFLVPWCGNTMTHDPIQIEKTHKCTSIKGS